MTSSSSGGQYLHLKAPAPVWEIGYLPTDFRIASLSIEQLWRSWHVATPSGPALQAICGKMLPAGENRNNDIRQLSRYFKVVQHIKGPSKVVAENLEEYFAALWKQCEDLAQDCGILLGSSHQGAGTFYNCMCLNKAFKEALLSPSRSVVVIVSQCSSLIAVPVNARNGVYFAACRERASALHVPYPPQQEPSITITSSLLMQPPQQTDRSPSRASALHVPYPPQPEPSITITSSLLMQPPQQTDRSPSQIEPSAIDSLTDFKLASLSVEQLWRAWHVATPSCPAMKNICGKVFTGQNRVNDIRQLSRYSRVVEFITGTYKIPHGVSCNNVEEYFTDLWVQCKDMASELGMNLGSTHQGASTFYNNICANNAVKQKLLSSSRIVSIVAHFQ
jgi:hypothetical protein